MSRGSYLAPFYPELDVDKAEEHEESGPTVTAPLRKLPPGPWRSMGGYLDYTHWSERERFADLDAAIGGRRRGSAPNDNSLCSRLRKCRKKIQGGGNCNKFFAVDEDYAGWRCEGHRDSEKNARPTNLVENESCCVPVCDDEDVPGNEYTPNRFAEQASLKQLVALLQATGTNRLGRVL